MYGYFVAFGHLFINTMVILDFKKEKEKKGGMKGWYIINSSTTCQMVRVIMFDNCVIAPIYECFCTQEYFDVPIPNLSVSMKSQKV